MIRSQQSGQLHLLGTKWIKSQPRRTEESLATQVLEGRHLAPSFILYSGVVVVCTLLLIAEIVHKLASQRVKDNVIKDDEDGYYETKLAW